jgi:hypothetical protein
MQIRIHLDAGTTHSRESIVTLLIIPTNLRLVFISFKDHIPGFPEDIPRAFLTSPIITTEQPVTVEIYNDFPTVASTTETFSRHSVVWQTLTFDTQSSIVEIIRANNMVVCQLNMIKSNELNCMNTIGPEMKFLFWNN